MSIASVLDVLLRNVEDGLPNAVDVVIKYLSRIKLLNLVVVLDKDKALLDRLMTKDFEPYWSGILQSFKVGDKEFCFKPPKFMSSGRYVIAYLLYLEHVSEKRSCGEFLLTAKKHHSFHALFYGVSLLIESFLGVRQPEKELNSVTLELYLNILEKEALFHGTPGYLLLANFCFQASLITTSRAYKLPLEERNEIFAITDGLALKVIRYLELALVLEKESESETHNAYFGQSIAMSNAFHVESIPSMIKKVAKVMLIDYSGRTRDNLKTTVDNDSSNFFYKLASRAKLDIPDNPDNPDKIDVPTDSSTISKYGETPFLRAIRTDPQVQSLSKAALALKDYKGNTGLHIAVCFNNLPLIKRIIGLEPSLVLVKNIAGETASDLATHPAIAKLIHKNYKLVTTAAGTSSGKHTANRLFNPGRNSVYETKDHGTVAKPLDVQLSDAVADTEDQQLKKRETEVSISLSTKRLS